MNDPLALTDVAWQACFVVVAIVVIVLALLSVRKAVEDGTKNAARAANMAAIKVDKVSENLTAVGFLTAQQLSALTAVSKSTHELVNGSMTTQLKTHAIICRRLADITNDQADIDAADLAEKMYREHEPVIPPETLVSHD